MRDITLCHPKLQELAGRLVEECDKQGLKIKIGETLRTAAEQDALYAQGRTKSGSIVTNASGSSYSSYHQWGTAFDIIRNDGKGAYEESGNFFERVGAIAVGMGLEWGGNWKSIVDKPHFQLPDWGSSTSGIKKLYATPAEFMKTWRVQQGWERTEAGLRYRKSDGSYPKEKWCIVSHHWYLFNKDCYACTGWHRWDGKVCDPDNGLGDWYFLDNTKNGTLEGACWHTKDNGAQEVWYVDAADKF